MTNLQNGNSMMKVYYAHSMHLYNKPQEARDIHTLKSLGFSVLNPADEKYKKKIQAWRKRYGDGEIMKFFDHLIESCQIVAFRPHIDGKIGGGVWYEIGYAKEKGMPIIELPNLLKSRSLDREETIEYLKLAGER